MVKTIKSSIKFKKFITFISEVVYLLTDFLNLIIALVGNLFKYKTFYKKDLVIVTACDKYFYNSLLQLIQSIAKYEKKTKVIFYDLGLEPLQKKYLKENYEQLENRVFDFSKYPSFFKERDDHQKLGGYAWKSAIVLEVLEKEKGNIIWLDSGNIITRRLNLLRIALTFTGFYSPLSNGTIQEWTHRSVLEAFSVEDKIRRRRNLTGGVVGFNYDNLNSRNIAKQWYDNSCNKEIITPTGSSRDNHRQDQSLLSIIIYNSSKLFFPLFKTKKLFGIKVNQNPGKRVYLGEGYGDSKASFFRSEWYKKNSPISTNTIKVAHFIWIINPDNWKKIPKKYLKEKILIIQFFHNYELDEKKLQIDLDKYKENVNYFFVESEDLYFYLKKQNINNIIRFSSKYDIQKYEEIFKELIEKAD